MDAFRRPPVLVIMGVSGSGKSTVAAALGERLGWAFQEGDDLHPAANVAKMAAGTPLDDADREPWLRAVAAWVDGRVAAGEPGVVTCSALRSRYRDVLRGPHVVFVFLSAPEGLVQTRLATRRDHFMPAGLLASQVEALEPPSAEEQAITLPARGTPAEQASAIIAQLGLLTD